jgi:hypothetical protein
VSQSNAEMDKKSDENYHAERTRLIYSTAMRNRGDYLLAFSVSGFERSITNTEGRCRQATLRLVSAIKIVQTVFTLQLEEDLLDQGVPFETWDFDTPIKIMPSQT